MAGKAAPIPPGFHSVTPYLTLNDCARAIDFYKRAFGAKEVVRMDAPGGKVGHAEIKIGDSIIMLADQMPGGETQSPQALGGTTTAIFLYVNNVDSAYKQAVDAGAKVEAQPADMFWGDRFGKLTDPFGHTWCIATHQEDIAPAEMKNRIEQEMAKMSQKTRTAS